MMNAPLAVHKQEGILCRAVFGVYTGLLHFFRKGVQWVCCKILKGFFLGIYQAVFYRLRDTAKNQEKVALQI